MSAVWPDDWLEPPFPDDSELIPARIRDRNPEMSPALVAAHTATWNTVMSVRPIRNSAPALVKKADA